MPAPEHIAALARAYDPRAWGDLSDAWYVEHRQAAANYHAAAILAAITAGGPAADAVLAALVESGRLVEEPIRARLTEPEWRDAT